LQQPALSIHDDRYAGDERAFARYMTGHDSQRREALVLGDGPRIQPLQVEELTADLLKIVAQLIQVNAALASRERAALAELISDQSAEAASAGVSNLPEIVRTMLRHPDLFSRHTDVGIQLLCNGALSKRDRELAILRIGWLCQAPYEWGEHVIVAKSVGIDKQEIERITRGSEAPGWNEHEQAILRAVEELHRDALISDATWATLSKRLDDRQLIELPILIGQYQAVAYYQNSLRLRLHGGNLGLKAR
jgi:alkylhydroperoxidase family enzyme